MPDCPDMIDGAVVILSVVLDLSRHQYTERTRLFADGSEQTWFHGLAIARYGRDSNDGDIYLFYCDELWETANDCCYATIEEAISEAARQFRVMRSDWHPVAWPFDQTKDTASISTVPVFRGGHPILFAQHFEDDHSWVFSCGTTNTPEDALVVCMRSAFDHDPTIVTISDLPPGWSADRADIHSPWIPRETRL
jgi:hypothetical protein